ncbi:MAG: hypothetical protein KDH89_03055, partial [Anaerolineae bacterium]|nr:hypothetical protein [Anaerolineae bacterium]
MNTKWKRLCGAVLLLLVGVVAFTPAVSLVPETSRSATVGRSAIGQNAGQNNGAGAPAEPGGADSTTD